MSEQERARLYAWLREQIDDLLAEYLMSCLAPAPLSDLVTKEFLRAELSRFATKDEVAALVSGVLQQREADRAEAVTWRESDRAEAAALRESDRAEAAALRESDRAEAAALRESDRAEARQRFRWIVGTTVASLGVIVAMFGILTAVILSAIANV
ncbi:hypothetical protein [Candidatus Poriferisodalis sp.]|uniref:hypothetical protein n=1 Tax=Candidatus Poriferisodalis sp. TaxID=3101277 RepID=UPI003B025BAA